MTLDDLLRETRFILSDEISAPVSSDDSVLSSDITLTHHLNLGQDLFCKRTGYIRDTKTAAVCSFNTVANQSDYSIHSSIIKILTLKYNGVTLGKRSSGAAASVLSGTSPIRWSIDADFRTVSLSPAPPEVKAIALSVWRKPITYLDVNDPNSTPEIPEDYHQALCHYAAGTILNTIDEELINPNAAAKQFGLFGNWLTQAKRDFLSSAFEDDDQQIVVGGFGWSW